MEGNILDSVSEWSPVSEHIHIAKWRNGLKGTIEYCPDEDVFRFYEFISQTKSGFPSLAYDRSDKSCNPIVAIGFICHWLRDRKTKGTAEIFESYFRQSKQQYVEKHNNEPDAWERNLEEEFACGKHLEEEFKLIERTKLAISELVGEEAIKTIETFSNNYMKFVRRKAKSLFPPQYPEGRKIESEFLSTFHGPAADCMRWIRDEYNIRYLRPHRPWFKQMDKNHPLLQQRQLTPEEQEAWNRHYVEEPRYVRWDFEDYNNDVLYYIEGGLMEEIEANLRSYREKEDRIRYVASLLIHFKDFADAFYPIARIRDRERSIEDHTKAIQHWSEVKEVRINKRTGEPIDPNERIEAFKQMIEHSQQDIEYWNEAEKKFHHIAQEAFNTGKGGPEMEYYLSVFWMDMNCFARRLAALLLTFHIKLEAIEDRCGIYLIEAIGLSDYVDKQYISDIGYARQLLEETERENAPKPMPGNGNDGMSGETDNDRPASFRKAIFCDCLDERKIVQTLSGMDRMGCGEKQFAQTVKEFFERLGWLVNRKDTDFVAWLKHHQLTSMRATGLTHVPQTAAMDDVADSLQLTFQFRNGKGNWEDKGEYYKKDRLKINHGL